MAMLGMIPSWLKYQRELGIMQMIFKKAAASLARNRHETGNNLLKKFGILKNRFEYSLKKHSMCFRACAVLTQLSIELGAMCMFDIADTYDDLNWLRLNLGEGMDEQDDSDNDL